MSFNTNNEGCDTLYLKHSVLYHATVASSKGVITCGGLNGGFWASKCLLLDSNGQTSFPSMTGRRSNFGMVNIKGIIYAIGGDPSYDTMETINIETGDQWQKESLPFKVDEHCVVNINTTIILIGGRNRQNLDVS